MGDQLKDTIWLGQDPTADQMLEGYRIGRFAMPYANGVYLWMSPRRRGILPLDNLRVTRSLRKSAKKYSVTFNADFAAVVARCADPEREGAWITDLLFDNYQDLHARGYAHSVEVWDDEGSLSGGLFIVNVGGLVCGEAMFHIGRDASKVALVALVERLRALEQPVLLDVQWRTDHLATLGVIEIPRKQYLQMLGDYVSRPNLL